MFDKIKVKKDSVQVHGVYPPAVPHIANMWVSAYEGRVINNMEPIHYPVTYFDDRLKDWIISMRATYTLNDLIISKRAMDMAVEMGYDTMEISKVHRGNLHKYKAVDLYFYKSDEE